MHRMRSTYLAAKKFLIRELPSPDAAETVESYLALPDHSDAPVSVSELFARLLSSAQNANMKAGVIGGAIGGIHNLGQALFRFSPKKVEEAFVNDPERLFDHIVKTLRPRGQ